MSRVGLWMCCGVLMAAPFHGTSAGPDLLTEVVARKQVRESQLLKYSVVRWYEVRNAAGRIQSAAKVLVRYDWPKSKQFQILEETGSHAIANMVFRPLIEHEEKISSRAEEDGSAIIPANYDVELTGEQDLEGRHCYVLSATPRRHDKYLFEGTIWVDAEELAVVQIEGRPAKAPSFWAKNVHFVRRYQKIGDYWLPRDDTSVSDVRMFGPHTLTIRYEDYEFDDQSTR